MKAQKRYHIKYEMQLLPYGHAACFPGAGLQGRSAARKDRCGEGSWPVYDWDTKEVILLPGATIVDRWVKQRLPGGRYLLRWRKVKT